PPAARPGSGRFGDGATQPPHPEERAQRASRRVGDPHPACGPPFETALRASSGGGVCGAVADLTAAGYYLYLQIIIHRPILRSKSLGGRACSSAISRFRTTAT